MRLNRTDWKLLDKLLAKMGFGGYYDLLEMLRMTALNLYGYVEWCGTCALTKYEIDKIDDLPTFVLLVHHLSSERKGGER